MLPISLLLIWDTWDDGVMGQAFFFLFPKRKIYFMTFLDCKDTVRLICFECNQPVFLRLVQMPWIESSKCIGFIHMATANSVRACEVQMLW